MIIFDTIIHLVKDSSIVVYDTIDNQFTTEFDINKLKGLKLKIDHYETISETFFDHTRYTMETRHIGLCPVIKTPKGNQKLFWIYIPYIRPYLVSFKRKTDSNPLIDNFADLLYFNEMPSIIVSHKLIYNKKENNNYVSFPNKLNFEAIEVEHDLWLKFHNGLKK